ncbi:C69 family dipeptidase, partial [Streptococcus pyogenes]
QLKKDIPAELGGGVMWLSIGSPRNAPYLPYLGNISRTYEAYQEKSTQYNDKSWYWTVSHINDLVAAHPKPFGTKVIDEMKGLEKTWIAEQDKSTKEISDLVVSDPKAAQEKADKISLDRAEKTFKRLKAIEAKLVEEKPQNKKGLNRS